MKSYEKKVLSKIVLSIPATVLELLHSKDECNTTFNLNKYVFFTAVVYSSGIGNEINSKNLYKFLGLNNLDGGKLKKDLINWNIIKEAYSASYKKQNDGKFIANNSAYYEVNLDYIFKPKVEYTMYSDRAKYINKAGLFDYLNVIVEKVDAKELKKLHSEVNKRRRERYNPTVKTTIKPVVLKSEAVIKQPVIVTGGWLFIHDHLFNGYDVEFISFCKNKMINEVGNFRYRNTDIGYNKDVNTKTITIKRVQANTPPNITGYYL
jgi:hypothetical protein